jgi:hypothetical protein
VAVLPRLNDLIRRPDRAANHAHWVFDTPTRNGCGHQKPNKIQRITLLTLLAMEVTRTADRKVSARRMGHHQIPTFIQ